MRRWSSLVLRLLAAVVLIGVLAPASAFAIKCGGKKAKIVGTPGNDRIVAPKFGKQVIHGGGGNDIIIANKGADRVCGGPGNDRLLVGRGKDRAYGGPGNDVIIAQKGTNRLNGDGGNDTIVGASGLDIIQGGGGDDTIGSAGKKDKVSGGGGDDIINGGPDGDTIHGDSGNDILRGGEGADKLYGDSGNDRVYGELLDDFLYGGSGDDLLVGAHGIDVMDGGSGNDWIRGGTNQDEFKGGTGSDTASFMSALPDNNFHNGTPGGVVQVDLRSGEARGPGGKDELSSIENVMGSAFDDTIIGNSSSNRLDGNLGNDNLIGNAGSDTLIGGPGDDDCDTDLSDQPTQACGGAVPELTPNLRPSEAFAYIDSRGPDTGIVVAGRVAGSAAGPQSESIRIASVSGGYLISGADRTAISPYSGGHGGDCVAGNAGVFCPNPSPNISFITVWGDNGADTISIGSGMPAYTEISIDGGPDNDTINGGANDEIIFSGQTGRDILNGGAGNDALISEGFGGDVLNGGSGDDQLVTDDVCQGHDYNGGSGQDIAGFGRYLRAFTSGGRVKVQLGGTAIDPGRRGCSATKVRSNNEILEGSVGDDILIGKKNKPNLLILGREGNDTIQGGNKPDGLLGNGGRDSLYGFGGYDRLDAKDGARDKVIDCGPGGGKAKKDRSDPKAKRCR